MSDSYIAVIKFKNTTAIHFGPFPSYEEADAFAQQKFTEYVEASCAYVDALAAPILYPGRKV